MPGGDNIEQKKAKGEALDIQHGIPYMGVSSVYADNYSDCKDYEKISDDIKNLGARIKRIEESWSSKELMAFRNSADSLKNVLETVYPHLYGGKDTIMKHYDVNNRTVCMGGGITDT